MASVNPDEHLEVTISHGFQKYTTKVHSELSGQPVTLKDLAAEIEKCTKVPVGRQKVIFKGRVLKDPETPLASCGIGNCSKIMVIGEKFDPESDENMKIMTAIEKRIKENEEKFHETEKEYKNLIKTTQKNENQYERKIKDFQNKISFIIENLSKNLENLDSLVLSEQLNDVKQKRRDLVKNIQNIITKCDSLDEEFANYNKKS